MRFSEPAVRIAVVGLGPRGLGAMEALAERATSAKLAVRLELFDCCTAPGAGPNFSPSEHPCCLLNIPIGAISIGAPAHCNDEAAPAWPPSDDPDHYPSRAEFGDRLAARFRALAGAFRSPFEISRHQARVGRLVVAEDGNWLETAEARHGPFDEVLLVPGQPETSPDDQLASWQAHASDNRCDLVPAYPTRGLLDAAEGWTDQIVAIRGLGLSTLDVLRLLTTGMGGRFENGRYRRGGREPRRILPFSLDGHPPAPKPVSIEFDRLFDPRPEETRNFETALERALTRSPVDALRAICSALVDPCLRILRAGRAEQDGEAVEHWLEIERDTPGAQETRPPVEALRSSIATARGETPFPLGYTIGQVWRKWQNELRSGFNTADVEPTTASALIGFDEGLKRYSYGPPVESAEELVMLIDEGIVELCAANDPDISMAGGGWLLKRGDDTFDVPAMVDAVLPSPAVASVTDPLIVAMRSAGQIVPVYEGSGARTRKDGQLLDRNGNVQQGISLLGRLALGSVIAVDSIHDCFGPSAERWARGVVERAAARRR